MSVVRIATNFNIELDFVSPPFHRRLAAWVVDMVIQVLYIYFSFDLLRSFIYKPGEDDRMKVYAFVLLLLLPLFTYHLVCELLMNGQSIGKKLLGIRVISENGGKPSISQFVIRWLIRTSDYTLLFLIIMVPMAQEYGSYIFYAFGGSLALLTADVVLVNSKKQQRLGDVLAHTILIETKQSESITDTVFLEVAQDYVPSFPEVMKLSDRDINALKTILDTARKRHDYSMAEMASQKIKSHLKIDTTLSAFDFLEVLMKDYNFLSAH